MLRSRCMYLYILTNVQRVRISRVCFVLSAGSKRKLSYLVSMSVVQRLHERFLIMFCSVLGSCQIIYTSERY